MEHPPPRHLVGLRVALLNWRDPWQRSAGGAEVFAYEISRGLVAAGASVDFLTSREPGQRRWEVRDGIRWVRRGGRWSVYPAVLAGLAFGRLRGRAYDAVIDCQTGIPFFSPLVVARRTRVIIVVHHVHDEQFGTHFSRPLAALGRWLEGPASRRVYRRATAVAVSPSTIAALRGRLRWSGPIELVYNGVRRPADAAIGSDDRTGDHAYERTDDGGDLIRSPTPRVVAVGRLVRHKRLDEVAALVDDLADTWPDLDVHLVGRGPDETRIRAGAARLEHAARVTVHGYLSNTERDALLRTAWLHVSASQGEGWGLSVLEAAALGIPSVAYDVDGLRDAIRDRETGWLAEPGERLADAVSRALKEIAAEPARTAEHRDACRARAAHFPWERSVARVVALLRDAI